MSAPWDTKVLDLLPGPLTHLAEVTAHPRVGAPFDLDVEDLALTYSEDWAPYVQASVTASLPAQALLDALDARQACRLSISAGYTYPDGQTEVYPMADLGLRDRAVQRPANTMDLTAASDEAITQDYTWRADFPLLPTTGINEAVAWCLEYSTIPFGYALSSSFPNGAHAGDLAGLVIGWGDSMWRMLDEIQTRTGRRIYCDETRLWRIRYRATEAGTSQLSLTHGEAGTLVDTSTRLSREDWFNEVTVVHEWTDGAGVDQRVFGFATITSGPLRPGLVGYKTKVLRSDRPISQAGANAKAAAVLRSVASRGRSLQVTATAAYWLRPGHTITVTLPTGDPELYLVQAVTFHPKTGLMDITTRQPLDVEITTGE